MIKLATATIRASKATSDSFFPIVGVTFDIGTTTFDRGVSFHSTSNSQPSLSNQVPHARNSSTVSPPMIDVAFAKATMLASSEPHSNIPSIKYSSGVIIDLKG
jgi:hypothetical protein